MTSEVVLLNKRLGILAADRQQTMPDGKTYTGVSKIFKLSPIHSCAVLINGNPDFQEVPIETLIGEFKVGTDFSNINSVGEIKDRFIDFLSKNTESTSADDYIEYFLDLFKDDLIFDINQSDFKTVVSQRPKRRICPFIKDYSLYSSAFDDVIPSEVDKDEYLDTLWEIFSFELLYESTGMAICGYDLDSHYPSFYEIELFFNSDGKIIFELVDSRVNTKEPFIKPLAIKDEACSFITGVHDDFIDFIERIVYKSNQLVVEDYRWNLEQEGIDNSDKLCNILEDTLDKEYSKLDDKIKSYRAESLEDITSSTEYLPPWVLTLFSGMLIQFTALKQKTSHEIESVSLDVDVLLISKTDGFTWVINTDERV